MEDFHGPQFYAGEVESAAEIAGNRRIIPGYLTRPSRWMMLSCGWLRCLALASLFFPGRLAVSQTVPTPATKASVCNVRDYGATGDGATLETAAIRKAIGACAAAGGGTVLFPPGNYVSGTFEMLSNITLNLEAGATIAGSKNLEDYGKIGDFGLGRDYGTNSSGEGERVGIIIARNAHDIAIVGRGAIDGRGDAFLDMGTPHFGPDFDPQYTRNPEGFSRAVRDTSYGPIEIKDHGTGRPGTMLIFFNCRNLLIRDVTLRAAPNWTLHLQSTEQAVISGIHIDNNPLIPNNDGIDCLACRHVHISDSDIRAGDDDFAFFDAEDVNVTNCSMSSRSAAIRLEHTRNSTFQNLTMEANRGIGIFQRGDEVTDSILFSNIVIRTKLIPGHWWGKAEPIYIAASPCTRGACQGGVRNVTFSNVIADAESGILIYGAGETPITGLTLDRVRLRIHAPEAAIGNAVGGNFDLRWTARNLQEAVFKHDIPGVYCRWVQALQIRGLELQWADNLPGYFSDGIHCEDFRDLAIREFTGRQAQAATGSAISLANGSGLSVTDSRAAAGTRLFLSLTDVTGLRVFVNHDLSEAKEILVPSTAVFKTSLGLPPRPAKRAAGAAAR